MPALQGSSCMSQPTSLLCIASLSKQGIWARLLLLQRDAADKEEQAHEEQRRDDADPVGPAQHRYA